jgi:hypothetical protein
LQQRELENSMWHMNLPWTNINTIYIYTTERKYFWDITLWC